jgi:hypothetical protein
MSVHAETLFAAGYALFLVMAAVGLDLLARHSQRRSERYRTAGFTYKSSSDAWECPQGERLVRIDTDPELRMIHYRARAHVCNSCRLKEGCTDSEQGRTITRPMDSWPHSEAGRFHRGIALVMVCLGALVIAAGAGMHHGPGDLVVLGTATALTALAAVALLADFRTHPSGFPAAQGERSGY